MRLLEKGSISRYLEEGYSTICELEPESEQGYSRVRVPKPTWNLNRHA